MSCKELDEAICPFCDHIARDKVFCAYDSGAVLRVNFGTQAGKTAHMHRFCDSFDYPACPFYHTLMAYAKATGKEDGND